MSSKVNNSARKFKVTGAYDHYKIDLGKVVVLMLGDRNDLPYPIGRSKSGKGYPAGAVTVDSFEWWKNEVQNNEGKIIITCHHHMLKETTAGTGEYEGVNNFLHGSYSSADEKASSYLGYVDQNESNAFMDYIEEHPACINYWLGAHTHLSPLDIINGRSTSELKYGVQFVNCGKMFQADGKDVSTRLICIDTVSNSGSIKTFVHKSNKHPKGWL